MGELRGEHPQVPVIGYATAALLAAGYGAVSVLFCSTVLARRDVTS